MQKIYLSLVFILFCQTMSFGQIKHIEIAAITTDSEIDLDFTRGDTVRHQIFVNQSVEAKNKLLVFLLALACVLTSKQKFVCGDTNKGGEAVAVIDKFYSEYKLSPNF